jgi:hypothetical protein
MEFDPVILKYDGLDADNQEIELAALGQSLQGAAQLLGSAAHVVLTGDYAKTALGVRIVAGIPKKGSWELPAIIMSAAPVVTPMLPIIADAGKAAAKKAVTSIISYVIEKAAPKGKSDVQAALATVEKSVAELGHTSRHAIDAVERIAANQRPAIRLFVAPIGQTCDSIQVGEAKDGAILVDRERRALIESPDKIQIGSASRFDILLSELDLKNQTCKFAIKSPDFDLEKRFSGQITDPIVQNPDSPYSIAFSKQTWLSVVAKPKLENGELDKLFISDLAT